MVPTLTWGLLRSNFSLATLNSSKIETQLIFVFSDFALRNDFISNIARSLRIFQKLHGVGRTPLSCRTQGCCITKHLRQWNLCINNLAHDAFVHPQDQTTTTVEISNNITHVDLRRYHFYLHNWLKQNSTTLLGQFLGCHRSSDFKRHFVRVNIMVRTIIDGSLQTQQRITGKNTVLHLLSNTFLNSRNIFFRYHTTHDLVYKLETFGV